MANLLIWWRQRTPSEQRLLLGLAGLLVVCASGTDYGSLAVSWWRLALMKSRPALD
ncbi:hypothetical protein [Klebsiella variicola]|uniref:hypothetical protein n=1 Tax=Klebsiella variicola TaxID=244366 RepID=UPI001D189506|nr:hypothetical protein [Klebsiella variicola]